MINHPPPGPLRATWMSCSAVWVLLCLDLGLEKSRTRPESLLHCSYRLFFTHLDPADPSRKFSFVLLVNDEEKYDVIDCDPHIDAKELVEILEELNGTDREDMSMLVRRMRKFLRIIITRFLLLHLQLRCI